MSSASLENEGAVFELQFARVVVKFSDDESALMKLQFLHKGDVSGVLNLIASVHVLEV